MIDTINACGLFGSVGVSVLSSGRNRGQNITSTMSKLNKYHVHSPVSGSSDTSAFGEDPMSAVRGLKVSYSRDGCGYVGEFEPEEATLSDSILGGKGGWEVVGKAHGHRAVVWIHRL